MIVLLAAGVGVCVLGLFAIGFGIPISETSFGNALLIAGVVILCTGMMLIGMWVVARELSNLAKLIIAQASPDARPVVLPRPAVPASSFAEAVGGPMADSVSGRADAPASSTPWADEIAARAKPRPPAPEAPPAEPAAAPPPPPDRPARRNLLFATKRRDKAELEPPAAPPLPTALEAEPRVSFENAWPNPLRPNGAAERTEPSTPPAETYEADAGRTDVSADAAMQARADLPPGVTVVRSGTVDEMAYTYFSDGSIEAQLAGESPIRFPSLDALRTYVEQRK